jgi:FAD/FMN-containing dehydrogenase
MADAFSRLRSELHGTLVLPGDEDYESARAVWNAAIDRRPAAVVRCTDTTDVIRAIRVARAERLSVAVRGGGHGFAGKATCDDGLVIDCSPMRRVEVNPARRLARAGAGCTLADFDAATQAHGLATTMGTVAPTGIAGLTLGGGLGWLMGRFGLACDNLIAADVVTAEGQALRASATENPDLLWGLRGGGGNFGVVTSFEYALHPVTTVYGGAVTYPPAQARDVFRLYRDLTQDAPDELTAYAGVQPLAAGGPAFSIVACWSGDPAAGECALAPLRRLGTPLADTLRAMPYLDMQALFAVPPVRVGSYAKSSFLRALDDAAIDALVARANAPAPPSLFFLEPVHGRASTVGEAESAFGHRGPAYSFAALALWFEPAGAAAATSWVRDFFGEMAPFLASGAYTNYLGGDESDARVRAAYGRSWDRLVALKRKLDPENFFRLNQNVDPAG